MYTPRWLFGEWLFGVCALLLASLLTTACVATDAALNPSSDGDDVEAEAETENVIRTTIVPTMRPSSAEELGIVLDDNGRPYDNDVGPQGTTTEDRLLGSMTIDRGRLYLIGGDAFLTPDTIGSADKTTINFRGATDLDVRVIWQQAAVDEDAVEEDAVDEDAVDEDAGDDEEPTERILALRIGAKGETVVEWGRFEDGYNTESGLGGVISRTSFEFGRDLLEPEQPVLDQGLIEGRSFLLADLTGEPGRDLLLFDNGTGPGSYQYSEGFNEDGRMVAIMIWHPRYPWRLAVTEGEPPPDVTDREQELIDCIEGRRTIDRWGRCT